MNTHRPKELCEEYGLRVESCGCCESPWVTDFEWAKDPKGTSFEAHKKHLREQLEENWK